MNNSHAYKPIPNSDELLLRVFEPRTYVLMSEGNVDMHCGSDRYLAEEFLAKRA